MKDEIGLADFIGQVKRELAKPPANDTTGVPLLMVDNVELQLQVVTSRDAKGGIKVNVLAATGELGGGLKRDDVHTVRVVMTPIQGHEERVQLLKSSPAWSRIQDGQRALDKGDADGSLVDQ